jgi:hypothetical protein
MAGQGWSDVYWSVIVVRTLSLETIDSRMYMLPSQDVKSVIPRYRGEHSSDVATR